MGEGPGSTEAERDIAERARAAGIRDMTARKAKRWRLAGIYGGPDVRSFPGRAGGGGSEASYSEVAAQEAVAYIVAAAPFVAHHRDLDDAILVMFWRGLL